MEEVENIKCKCLVEKKGVKRTCDRHLLKRVDKKTIHLPCSACGGTTMLFVDEENNLMAVHTTKEGRIL